MFRTETIRVIGLGERFLSAHMSPPSLNEDVLALIVKEVARQAVQYVPDPSPAEINEQWLLRSKALCGLALVSRALKPLAQAELARFIWVDHRTSPLVVHASHLDLRLTRRIVIDHNPESYPSAKLGLLEQCENMEQLAVNGGPFSLCSIARPSHPGEP